MAMGSKVVEAGGVEVAADLPADMDLTAEVELFFF